MIPVKLEEVLTLGRKPVEIIPSETYKQITVKLHHKGVVLRGEKYGYEIKSKQYLAKEGQFIISRIDARNGAMGIIPQKLHGAVVTNDFLLYDIDEEKLFPKYFDYITSSESFVNICLKASEGTTNRVRLKPQRFLAFEVLIPSLEEQKLIVKFLEKLVSKSEKAVRFMKESIEETQKIMQAALSKVYFKAEKEGWEWTKLGKVTWVNGESRNPSRESPNEEFIYIDISCVEGGTGRITKYEKTLGRDAPSRARRVVHTDDVIMSTVRPYLKSFAIIPKEFDGQICSTGFAVLLCRERLLPKYLLYILFSDEVIRQFNEMTVGAHYPALRKDQVTQIRIPLPPLEKQKTMAGYFDTIKGKIESLKNVQQRTEEKLEELIPVVRERVFRGKM